MAPKAAQLAKELVRNTGALEVRKDSDTLSLWESYREQATLWRSLALLQIPATVLALVFAMVMWSNRTIQLKVPATPKPGIHKAEEIPDNEFLDTATNFVNLIATYQPNVARKQFAEAGKMLSGAVIQIFKTDWEQDEMRTIESSNRTQVFFVDPTKTTVDRSNPRQVKVVMTGERQKFVAGKEVPLKASKFSVTMETIPQNPLNPYGIVVTNFKLEDVEKE